ncbi:hypothetical protein E4U30_005567 [Claviceps sp. LM220 group G6]|nr:hypothetical protein E4U30_005567 [Claviceps sp. LM220 group G6]KAG6107496.1 hypothetical protein E4U31_008371 [Claviceps sp. LM219 group G6]
MATRQERIDERVSELRELKKTHPEIDLDAFVSALTKSINLEFDVKEKLGDETWDKMNESLTGLTKDSLPDDLAKAKSYLQGHKDLEEKFDAIYSNMGSETVAYARDVCTGDR